MRRGSGYSSGVGAGVFRGAGEAEHTLDDPNPEIPGPYMMGAGKDHLVAARLEQHRPPLCERIALTQDAFHVAQVQQLIVAVEAVKAEVTKHVVVASPSAADEGSNSQQSASTHQWEPSQPPAQQASPLTTALQATPFSRIT